MATKKAVQKKYNVNVRAWVDTTVEVVADSLEDAIEASKKVSLDDAITIHGDHNDSGFRVTGIFEDYVSAVI